MEIEELAVGRLVRIKGFRRIFRVHSVLYFGYVAVAILERKPFKNKRLIEITNDFLEVVNEA